MKSSWNNNLNHSVNFQEDLQKIHQEGLYYGKENPQRRPPQLAWKQLQPLDLHLNTWTYNRLNL
jgi:hypothetical protein